MNQANQSAQETSDDGMSIGEMFSRVGAWVDRHYRILRFLFIAAIALVIAAACVLLLVKPPRVTYATVISYNFPQAERGFYPNGAPFAVTDVVSAKVLEAVWTKNQLGDLGLPLTRFVDSVSIVQYAQNEEFIREKYRAMLQRKNLSQTDVAAIEKDFSDELNAASRKQSRLTMTLPFRSQVSGDVAAKVLADIPRTWSTIAINDLGVSSVPGLLTEGINQEFVKSAHPFQVADYFFKSVAVFNGALSSISSFPGGDTLRDPKTGRGVDDLRQRLSDLSRYSLQSFDDTLQESMRVPEGQVRSAERSLRELKNQQEEFLAQARVHRQALVDYDAIRLQESRLPSQADPRAVQQSNSLQLQGDSIQRLINLGSQNKDAEFRQELTRKRVSAEVAAASLEPQIDRLKRRIEAARKPSPGGLATADLGMASQEISEKLRSVAETIGRLQDAQMARFLDGSGLLYRVGTVTSTTSAGLRPVLLVACGVIVLLLALLLISSAFRGLASNRAASLRL
jgi:hypothetical protein